MKKQIESHLVKLLRDPNRFKKLEDGWVRDSLTGLEWGPTAPEQMTWVAAKKYCAKLGGRLPEVNELQSIVDYANHDPVINKDIFPDTKSSWYWSGTQHASYSDCAWFVCFYNGNVSYYGKVTRNYVWPVRSSQII